MLKIVDSCKNIYLRRSFCFLSTQQGDENTKKHKRKITETVELINLVNQNDKILGLKPKSESLQLARKMNLSLQKVEDPKYGKQYPAYKLVSPSELLKTVSKASSAKSLKKLPLNARITDHDLETKLQTIKKWIAKKCEVHIAVSCSPPNKAQCKILFDKMREGLKDDGRIVDVRSKEEAISFTILPPKSVPEPVKK